MQTRQIEIVSNQNTLCGEGPLWDATNHRMLWVDIEQALIFEYRLADEQTSVLSRDLPASGLAMNHDGRLVIASAKGICLLGKEGHATTVLENPEGGDYYFNDITAGQNGRLYAGAAHWNDSGMQRLGCLYLIDKDGSVRAVDEGIKLSNGLGFSPDNRTFYYADSSARKIYAYDVATETGSLANKRTFVDVPVEDGLPDGLTIDAESFVWCQCGMAGRSSAMIRTARSNAA